MAFGERRETNYIRIQVLSCNSIENMLIFHKRTEHSGFLNLVNKLV